MRKVTMLFSAAAVASTAYRMAAAVKRIPVLVFLAVFASRPLCLDAGESGMEGYECCTAWDSSREAVEAPAHETAAADAEDTWISEEYQKYCREVGKEYNICPELLMAMVERESNGEAYASNSAGDSGLLQVNPRWHRERMERLGATDLYDPYSNILVAADYLAELFEWDGDLYLVLMEYNMGSSTAKSLYYKGIYSEYAVEVAQRAWELEKIHEKESGAL